MVDLQSIYIRDVVKLFDIDFVTMIKVVDEDLSALTGVTVNGIAVGHISTIGGVLYVALPAGLFIDQVSSVRLVRSVATSDGSYEVTDLVSPSQISADSGLLKVTGEDFSKVASVRVNRQEVDHVVIDGSTLYSTLPTEAKFLESIDVISSSNSINRTSFFEYLIGSNPNTVSGPSKMVFQFLKVMMTTPGTDIFKPDMGGNLQNWVGQRLSLANPQALVAKTILNVSNVAKQMSAQQLIAKVPPEERIADVQILDVGFDEASPDVMELDIRIRSYSQQTAIFSLMLGTLDGSANNLVIKE